MYTYIISGGEGDQSIAKVSQILAEKNCEIIRFRNIQELISNIDGGSDDIIIIVSGGDLDVIELSKFISGLANRAHVFYVSNKINTVDYKILGQLGNVEFTDWEIIDKDISSYFDSIEQNNDEKKSAGHNLFKQVVVSFVGTAGGVGNTTLAMEVGVDLATKLSNRGQKKIAYLDLDNQGGAVCDYLGVEARLNMEEIRAKPGRLDSYMLEIMATKHASGLDIFSPRASYNINKYLSEDVGILSLLNCVVDNYSVTLIDIPHRCPIETAEIVKNSDFVYCVSIFSVPNIRLLKKKIDNLINFGVSEDRTSIILTHVDTNFMGAISLRFNIDIILKNWPALFVRRDSSFALECVDMGVSMVQSQPKKGISQDIQKVSDGILAFLKA